jgi:hypothetical protein
MNGKARNRTTGLALRTAHRSEGAARCVLCAVCCVLCVVRGAAPGQAEVKSVWVGVSGVTCGT